MADETLEVEGKVVIEQEEQSPVDPVEAIARDMGWTPKEEWRGDETKFKEASDFIRDTARINSDRGNELKALKETTSRIANVTETLMAERIAERDAYWQNQHREAVELGDVEAAEKAVAERARNNATAQPATPPETQEFVSRNSWFGKEPLATKLAKDTAQAYAEAGYSVPDQLKKAEERVRKEFPELFPTAKPAPSVGAPASRQAGTSKANPVDQLPPEALAVAKDMEERLGVPVAKFAEKWVAEQGAKK